MPLIVSPLKPQWIELADDVRILTRIHDLVGEEEADRARQAAKDAGRSDLDAGLTYLAALIVHTAVEWQGVVDTDGRPLPLEMAAVRDFVEQFLETAVAWRDARAERWAAWELEKKGSLPAPNGTGTAAASASDASPAAAPPAPTKRKRRRAARASSSGMPSRRSSASSAAPT